MEPIRISIPTPRPAEAAAWIVLDKLRAMGMSPQRALNNPLVCDVCVAWTRGDLDDAGFKRCIENMLILNPTLAFTGAPK